MKKKVLVVVGPTAVGKTAFGIRLAKDFKGEIISGDSQQVYRGLDIGTAKATDEEFAAAKHHLIDTRSLNAAYSVHDFVEEATAAIESILSAGKCPIIVGGTGLYIQALTEGYHLGGRKEDREAVLAYRESLCQLSDEELSLLSADKIIREPNRRRRIRALEIEKFGNQLTEEKEKGESHFDFSPSVLTNTESPYDFYFIGLELPREQLYARINTRVDAMLQQGLLQEARMVYDNFPHTQAAKGIGYKEFFPYFEGVLPLEMAVGQVKQHTRHYAKRQLTWFKNRMTVRFYDVSTTEFPENAIIAAEEFLDGKHKKWADEEKQPNSSSSSQRNKDIGG